MKKYVIYLLISLIIGCGGSNYQQTVGPVKESTIYDIVKDGWYYYENEEYTLALSKFDRAIKINNQYADAYNGLGWTYLGLQNISLSLSNFEKMTNLNENLMDGWAGKTFAFFENSDYNNSIQSAYKAISIDSSQFDLIIPDYTFSHNNKVTARSIFTVLAFDYFYLGNFKQSYVILREYINNTVSLDTTSVDFPEELLNELEKL